MTVENLVNPLTELDRQRLHIEPSTCSCGTSSHGDDAVSLSLTCNTHWYEISGTLFVGSFTTHRAGDVTDRLKCGKV